MPKKKQPHLTPGTEVSASMRSSRGALREDAVRLLRAQQRRERRRTLALQAGFGVVIVAIVLGVTVGILADRDQGPSGSAPPGLTADGAVRFGAEDAPVALQVVEDFQCPACQQFEGAVGELLADYRDSGDVAIEYRPIAFLDRASTTNYSSRALNASMCVLADDGKDTWLDYHQALYVNQPEEGGAGLPDERLTSLAVDVGASAQTASCIEAQTYSDWVEEQTRQVQQEGVTGTPTLLVNGEILANSDPDSIRTAVEAAGAGS